ncbi:cyclophilin-like protein [Lindgomyces ingoldianus]|uniref:Cyclophilin-like protein n=1 Tax=Lindgomyces ingoldianus TaxID=673940 RepID=A0ACB6R750_9PLEO|nr:cyclophilin-like protein [Lindgomyces ingoldianus]KAF2474142.1 cyclophilin-like protein [Lindgomyces ingoldianus]
MSTVYNLEPQPTAKVLLQTTSGDLELELFATQTPVTSRNFLQLCLDGYYDNTVFHRLVKGFIIQGGDPTGTGQGGESSYDGDPFADEFHSRLKFNRRGLLGMANTGQKDDNGSQFFFTLGNTPELTGKNTLFGRIAGDTIYNLMKMAEADIADNSEDRPLYPTKITGAEIIINPFEDMVKRVRVAQRTQPEAKKVVKKPKRKAGKTLLSFGGDEGEEAAPIPKKPKYNAQLVSAGEEALAASRKTAMPKAPREERAIPIRKPSRNEPSRSPPPKRAPQPVRDPPPQDERPSSPSTMSGEESPKPQEQTRVESVNAQIASVIASMKRKAPVQSAEMIKKKSALEAMIPSTSTRGRKRGAAAYNAASEKATLDILSAFKSKLESAQVEDKKMLSPPPIPESEAHQNGGHQLIKPTALVTEEEVPCDLHFIVGCQSCSAWDKQDQDESDDDAGWMSHQLTFEKDRLGKDLEWKRKNEQELVVIDPREKARELKEKGKAKRREWDG